MKFHKKIFEKFFGKKNKPKKKKSESESGFPALNWIEPTDNPWGIKVLDLRPTTQGMISTSQNPEVAENALSYNHDDGASFINEEPDPGDEISADISLAVDPLLDLDGDRRGA